MCLQVSVKFWILWAIEYLCPGVGVLFLRAFHVVEVIYPVLS